MAERVTIKNKGFQDILRILQVKSQGDDSLVIVNSRVLQELLFGLPEVHIKNFVEGKLSEPKITNSLPLKELVKAVRDLYGDTQGKFAERLRVKGLKIHSSDIGNIEIGHRVDLYRPKRQEKIRTTVLELLDEVTQKKRE